MRNGGTIVRLSHGQWLGHDPGDRMIAIAYDAHGGLWQIRFDGEREPYLDDDLCAALAQATETDPDEPWLVDLADEIERDLRRAEEEM